MTHFDTLAKSLIEDNDKRIEEEENFEKKKEIFRKVA
jgi:hypothetical protein